jgi:hypothetical protein
MGRASKKKLIAIAVACCVKAHKVCAECRYECADEPSEESAFYPPGITCPECDGRGCAGCRFTGNARITCCPRKLVTGDVLAILESADDARKGFLPVAGGTLDQTAAAMEAIRFIWRYEDSLGR